MPPPPPPHTTNHHDHPACDRPWIMISHISVVGAVNETGTLITVAAATGALIATAIATALWRVHQGDLYAIAQGRSASSPHPGLHPRHQVLITPAFVVSVGSACGSMLLYVLTHTGQLVLDAIMNASGASPTTRSHRRS